ncbi:uncharacterized protein ATNIH1004_003920 [Aspergillus tanneri]|nr:uncharacterized protein ATNIH1004_003920 [Aspergillus tanneri]KAA8648037.1 hypothetical protein ATNIH1004_003920 [Aspergillus tanneri]
MDGDAKFYYFQSLVRLGYKEIEISYPSSSQTDFDFTRRLSTSPGEVPDDVWIQVMAPCREELIRRTVESVRGANKVIVHLHLSTSECFRRIVFNKTEEEMIDLAVRCTRLLRELTKDSPDPEVRQTEWTYEFTPENFQHTSVEFAVEICEAVKAVWEPTEQNQIIFNLPSTIEVAMPNVFADQIETFCDSITEREKVCVSLHTHNDRGCAVAAAEMAQLAGADRVEGCLFGNGERTGNVDLVTLALNLYTQGVHPGIDFSDINQVVTMVEELTKVPVPLRAPYAGKYVFCTFTGTHQDAIRKGYKRRRLENKEGELQKWEMPYLPMDPEDLGRKHEAIIRVNSQSGKSGIAWLVKEVFDIDMPLELELLFTRVVQDHANKTGLEVTTKMIKDHFETNYMLVNSSELQLLSCNVDQGDTDSNVTQPVTNRHAANGHSTHGKSTNGENVNGYATNGHANGNTSMNGNSTNGTAKKRKITNGGFHESATNKKANENTKNGNYSVSLQASVAINGARHNIRGSGPELITSITDAASDLGFSFDLLDHKTQILDSKPNTPRQTVSFVKLGSGKMPVAWGVGIHEDPVWASMQAVLKAGENLRVADSI